MNIPMWAQILIFSIFVIGIIIGSIWYFRRHLQGDEHELDQAYEEENRELEYHTIL